MFLNYGTLPKNSLVLHDIYGTFLDLYAKCDRKYNTVFRKLDLTKLIRQKVETWSDETDVFQLHPKKSFFFFPHKVTFANELTQLFPILYFYTPSQLPNVFSGYRKIILERKGLKWNTYDWFPMWKNCF